MGAGERNVTSAIYCVNHNSLHWNDVFSIIAATEVDSKVGERFGGFKYFLTTKFTKISYLQIISRPLPPLRLNLIISVLVAFTPTKEKSIQSSFVKSRQLNWMLII